MNNILDTFIKVAENEGIKITQLEKELGASKGVLSRAINNNSDVQAKWFMKLVENYPQYNLEWLVFDKGTKLKKDVKHTAYISPEGKGIPLVSTTAIGGFGNSKFCIEDKDIKDYYIIPKFNHKKVDFMIEVEGSSMYPKYNSGDIVACRIIDEKCFIQWNKAHVIATRGQGIILKRIKPGPHENSLLMISDNKDFDPFVVNQDEIDGIALVIGVIRLE